MAEQRNTIIAELEETGAVDSFDHEVICVKAGTVKAAIELLKAQEPVMHSSRRGTNSYFSLVWTCGKCGADLEPNNRKARYCSSCGQAVKWE